jgi:hypothetical protein
VRQRHDRGRGLRRLWHQDPDMQQLPVGRVRRVRRPRRVYARRNGRGLHVLDARKHHRMLRHLGVWQQLHLGSLQTQERQHLQLEQGRNLALLRHEQLAVVPVELQVVDRLRERLRLRLLVDKARGEP